jgi:hypothetical protein
MLRNQFYFEDDIGQKMYITLFTSTQLGLMTPPRPPRPSLCYLQSGPQRETIRAVIRFHKSPDLRIWRLTKLQAGAYSTSALVTQNVSTPFGTIDATTSSQFPKGSAAFGTQHLDSSILAACISVSDLH